MKVKIYIMYQNLLNAAQEVHRGGSRSILLIDTYLPILEDIHIRKKKVLQLLSRKGRKHKLPILGMKVQILLQVLHSVEGTCYKQC